MVAYLHPHIFQESEVKNVENSYKVFERLCKKNKVTPYRVAKETGIVTATFSEWKKGTYKPKLEKLSKIAKFFNVEVTEFLD